MTSPYRTIAQWLIDKESVCNAEDVEHEFDPWVRKSPWRRKWQPTSVFLHGKSHGPRSLADYSPWGRTESDTTEHITAVADMDIHYPHKQKLWGILNNF